MKNQILDDFKEERKGSTFSKLSFLFAVLALMGLVWMLNWTSKEISVANHIEIPPSWLTYSTLFSNLLGFLFIIISIAKKEKSSFFKWVGGILNILLFLCFFGILIFSLTKM